jgi:hypothetical protein
MHVNVASCNASKPPWRITGTLKAYPQDFIVTERQKDQGGDQGIHHGIPSAAEAPAAGTSPLTAPALASTTLPAVAVTVALTEDELSALSVLNNQIRSVF